LSSTGKAWTPDVSSFVNAKGVTLTPASGSSTYYAADSTRISVKGTAATPIIYELPTTATNTILGAFTGDITTADGAVDYYTAKNDYPPLGSSTVVLPSTVTETLNLDDASVVVLNTLSGEYNIGTLRVRIWIEGWDPDCFNSILGDILTVGLVFEARAS
jgi:hypothetical protein